MKTHFGEKIREIRERRKMTMKEVAERAGLSESLISQIERNRVSPAIDTLLKIVDILDIDIDYLFSDLKKERSVVVVRKNERQKTQMSGVKYEKLSRTPGNSDDHAIEAYLLEIAPGGQSGGNEYGHLGKELGVILSGHGTFSIGNQVIEFEEGDSLSFSSDVPHVLKNTGDVPLRAFWVITPPKHFIND